MMMNDEKWLMFANGEKKKMNFDSIIINKGKKMTMKID